MAIVVKCLKGFLPLCLHHWSSSIQASICSHCVRLYSIMNQHWIVPFMNHYWLFLFMNSSNKGTCSDLICTFWTQFFFHLELFCIEFALKNILRSMDYGLSAPVLVQCVPCLCFPSFGPQRIRNLAFVCP